MHYGQLENSELRSLCSYSSRLELNFLSMAYFSQTFNHVCLDLIVVFFFSHLDSVGQQLFRQMK